MIKMEFERYAAYKDSGVEWIGEIPSHWEVRRVKEVGDINKSTLSEKTPASYEFDYVDIGSVTYGVKGYTKERMDFDVAPSRAKRIVQKGDTIISTVRTYLKAIATIDEEVSDLIVSTGFAVISPRKEIVDKFCSYLLTSNCIVDEICALSTGVSYPATNATVIGDLFFLIPPVSEQQAIAAYLDTKTAHIDRQIDLLSQKALQYGKLKQSLINETVTRGLDKSVTMKDSGIERLGEVPEHWELKRLKEIGFLFSGLTGKSGEDFTDENIYSAPFVPFTNISNNFYLSKEILKYVVIFPNEKQNIVRKFDIFFLMSSEDYADLGKCSLLIQDMDTSTYLNSFCKGFRFTKKNIHPLFINYLLHSSVYRNNLSNEGKGFTRINLKIEKVNDIRLILPSLKEQQAIADYLDTKTANIDNIIETINTKVAKLKELRKRDPFIYK